MIAQLAMLVPPAQARAAEQSDAWTRLADRLGDGMLAWAPVLLAALLILAVGVRFAIDLVITPDEPFTLSTTVIEGPR